MIVPSMHKKKQELIDVVLLIVAMVNKNAPENIFGNMHMIKILDKKETNYGNFITRNY